MSQRDTIIHLVAGGIAGTNGAVLTCPLEVVKTRLQSSNPTFGKDTLTTSQSLNVNRYSTFQPRKDGQNSRSFSTCGSCGRSAILSVPHHGNPMVQPTADKIGLIKCLRLIIEKEGPRALFSGLGMNLVGVAPSRAIYFSAYSTAKRQFNDILPPDSPVVHICSAATAGFVASTTTNPIWFVKTRLQLEGERGLGTKETIRRIYRQGGLLAFYKGISASYMGISETVIHFVIYEAMKKKLQEWNAATNALADNDPMTQEKTSKDFLQFMAAGACSKTIASCIAYPHEVARTRLREEGHKYRHLVQTLCLVGKEEGHRGLYRGLATQLIRQIPNTAIMMSTYELSVYLLSKSFPPSSSSLPVRLNDFDDTSYDSSPAENQLGS